MSQSPVIELRDLHVHFRGVEDTGPVGTRRAKTIRAVDGVNLTVNRREIISLVGESGSGKTTLGRTIVGLTKPTSGQVKVDSDDVDFENRSSLKRLWKKTQMIFQDPYSTFNPLSTIQESLEIPLQKYGLSHSPAETSDAIRGILSQVGLEYDEIAQKYPRQLSGGQRQRIAIARTLLVQPEVIVADEPVSMLDVSLRAGILDLIKTLNSTRHVTFVFVTHDLAVAQYLSNRIAVMYAGRIVELGPSLEIVESPLHPYTELLLRSSPKLQGERKWTETQDSLLHVVPRGFRGCSFYPRCPLGNGGCTEDQPPLVQVGKDHYVACYVRGKTN